MGMKVSSFWFKVIRDETFNPDNNMMLSLSRWQMH